ncbi:MAG TPA: hypothetical protein VIK99_01920 [Thermaerobacter sp.]
MIFEANLLPLTFTTEVGSELLNQCCPHLVRELIPGVEEPDRCWLLFRPFKGEAVRALGQVGPPCEEYLSK